MRLNRGVIALVLILLPGTIAAETKQPKGFGKLAFGTPIDEAQKIYPDLKKLADSENLGAPPVGGPYITRYALRDQTIPGLPKPVTVELRFWKDKFWLYVVYFDKAGLDAVLAHLKSEYGEPTETKSTVPLWIFEKTTILVEPKAGRYTVNDHQLSDQARLWFVETLKQGHPEREVEIRTPLRSATRAPSPAATQP